MNDQLVVYIVIRNDLGMSFGKTCAQAAHSCQYLLQHYFAALLIETKAHIHTAEHQHIEAMTHWMHHGSKKVVLKASDEEWGALKEAFGKECFIVRDAGLTEIKAGEETAMIMCPVEKSKAHRLIKGLSTL